MSKKVNKEIFYLWDSHEGAFEEFTSLDKAKIYIEESLEEYYDDLSSCNDRFLLIKGIPLVFSIKKSKTEVIF